MEVFKTYLFFSGFDEGHPYLIDTVFLDKAWWLVGSWLQSNDTGEKVPEKLVCLSELLFQEVDGKPYRFLLNNALPKAVLDGEEIAGYTLRYYPDLTSLNGPSSLQ